MYFTWAYDGSGHIFGVIPERLNDDERRKLGNDPLRRAEYSAAIANTMVRFSYRAVITPMTAPRFGFTLHLQSRGVVFHVSEHTSVEQAKAITTDAAQRHETIEEFVDTIAGA